MRPAFTQRRHRGAVLVVIAFAALAAIITPLVVFADHTGYGVFANTFVPANSADVVPEGNDGITKVYIKAYNNLHYSVKFAMDTWVVPDNGNKQVTYPAQVHMEVKKLTGTSPNENIPDDTIQLSLAQDNFTGLHDVYYNFTAAGDQWTNYVPVYIKVTVPACGDIQGNPHYHVQGTPDKSSGLTIGPSHGIMVYFSCVGDYQTPTPVPTGDATSTPSGQCVDYWGNPITCTPSVTSSTSIKHIRPTPRPRH